MSANKSFPIFERDTTITSSKLRQIGYIPATIYGKGMQPLSIQLKAHAFEVAFGHGQRRFTLEGLGNVFDTEIKQIQLNNAKGNVLHIEFYVANVAAKPSKKAVEQAEPAEPVAV